ncbi:MAG: hypothetical protein D6721_03515 [Gammaproteobacteria bacterium]|nr:MAG: hypothetical protein D6721_03515 [Gammaproteobacteria bacterium]
MTDKVLPFRRPRPAERHRGKTLCRRGFHEWVVVDTPFDVKSGRLVTRYRCTRCGRLKIQARG